MNANKRHSLNYNCLIFIIVLFSILSFMGCVSGWVGKTVPLQNRITIEDGEPHRGSWIRPHATFNYTFTRKSGQLELTGDISVEGPMISGRGPVTSFHFWIHYIDDAGTIILSRIIFSSTRSTRGVIKQNLELPPDTAGITFSYTGQYRAKMLDSQPYSFHSSPLYQKNDE